jgi:hypothetical protein
MLHRLAVSRKERKGKEGKADEVPDLPDEIHLKLGVIYQEANGFREDEIELGKASISKPAQP